MPRGSRSEFRTSMYHISNQATTTGKLFRAHGLTQQNSRAGQPLCRQELQAGHKIEPHNRARSCERNERRSRSPQSTCLAPMASPSWQKICQNLLLVGPKHQAMKYVFLVSESLFPCLLMSSKQANLFSFLVVYDNWRKQLLPGMSFGDFLKQIEGLAGHVNIKVRRHLPLHPAAMTLCY